MKQLQQICNNAYCTMYVDLIHVVEIPKLIGVPIRSHRDPILYCSDCFWLVYNFFVLCFVNCLYPCRAANGRLKRIFFLNLLLSHVAFYVIFIHLKDPLIFKLK